MLCPALRGRIQYFLTRYHGAPDDYGRFCVRVDGKEYVPGNPYCYWHREYSLLEQQLKAERNIPPREWTHHGMLHEAENEAVEQEVRQIAWNDGVFEDYELYRAIREYRESSISDSLHAANPLVRMLAVLDRRVGKRTLEKLRETVDEQPEWLRFFYRLRLEAEGIPLSHQKSQ